MSVSPFVTALRSLNHVHLVEGFSKELIIAYDTMKLPRIEKRIKAMNSSFDNNVTTAKATNEFATAEKLKELSEKIKEISDFSAKRYSGRVFKNESATKPELSTNLSANVQEKPAEAN
jgi:hypothetical protein